MIPSLEKSQIFQKLASELYNSINLDRAEVERDKTKFPLMQATDKIFLALDNRGYKIYKDFVGQILEIAEISTVWSEDGIKRLVDGFLIRLATIKAKGERPDYKVEVEEWMSSIIMEFEECKCYIPVIGLFTEAAFSIGAIDFIPIKDFKIEADKLPSSFLSKVSPYRNCIAHTKIKAEPQKANELFRINLEYSLNVFNILGDLIWYNQPPKHIYVAGTERKNISYSLVICKDQVLELGKNEFNIAPFQVDNDFLQRANSYGLEFIQNILKQSSRTELEKAYLTAIQWYGDAVQEITPSVAFVKYYVAIECVLKQPNEYSAKKFIPERVGVLIEPWGRKQQEWFINDIETIIDERNNILHSGEPKKRTEDSLAWATGLLARQVLHQLRLNISSNKWKAKNDIILWVKAQRERLKVAQLKFIYLDRLRV